MRRALLYLGLFMLLGIATAFILQRVMRDAPPPPPPPVEEPGTPPDTTLVPPDSTGWHEAPPDSVPPPEPVRPHPGHGHGRPAAGDTLPH